MLKIATFGSKPSTVYLEIVDAKAGFMLKNDIIQNFAHLY